MKKVLDIEFRAFFFGDVIIDKDSLKDKSG